MKDYILFLCECDIDERTAEELHKENIECLFLKNEILEAIKLFSPLALVVDELKLNLLEGIKENKTPIIVLAKNDNEKQSERENFNFVRINDIWEIVNLAKLIKLSAYFSIYSFNSNIFRKDIGENILLRSLQNKPLGIKNRYLLITKFFDQGSTEFQEKKYRELYSSINHLFSTYNYFIKAILTYRVDISTFASFYTNLDLDNFIKNLKKTISTYYNGDGFYAHNINLKFKIIDLKNNANKVNLEDFYYFNQDEIFNKDILVESDRMESSRILLIDEDNIITNILKYRYTNKGYDVIVFNDLLDAYNFLNENKADLVITELYTKSMNADDFLIKLKEQEIDTPVIILSGQKNESLVNKILNLGAVDYISKPFSPIELDARLEKMLD